MGLAARVLVGLGAGFLLGALVAAADHPTLLRAVSWIEPFGTLWVNAIRMTVIPLVVATLVAGVASARGRRLGRVGGAAVVLFLALTAAGALLATLIAPPVLAWLPVDPEAAAALRASAADAQRTAVEGARQLPTLRDWLVGLVPANPVKAAADGAILPLIVASLAFGLALMRVPEARREPVLRAIQGVADAFFTLVRWVLAAAPVGVFALALPLATRFGAGAAGAILYYIALVSALCTVATAGLYPVAVVGGRVSLRRFARAAAPAQAVAMSSRSSLASLPVMIQAAEERLALPREVSGVFLPITVSLFRIGSAIGIMTGVLFSARLYGVTLAAPELVGAAATAVVVSFGVPGIPGGSILVMVPALLAAGVPVEGAGLLLGVDVVPDMFRTTANVSGQLTAATVLARVGVKS
ncbi:MAG: cation:dicarboxylase symporter family transporter [Gemmatimonadetes bacterium]|nr:cation:dicarboxylase symporter family transporter [Gemmatimonadota bacterium]